MKYLQIGFRIFCRHLGLSLLLSLQLAIGILLANVIGTQAQMQRESLKLFAPLASEQTVYFMPAGREGPPTAQPDYFAALQGVDHISSTGKAFLSQGQTMTVYDDALWDTAPMPLQKGDWFAQAQPGELAVVIDRERGPYQYGAAVDLQVEVAMPSGEREMAFIRLRVTGVLDPAGRYLRFNVGGNAISSLDLVRRYDSDQVQPIVMEDGTTLEAPLLLCRESALRALAAESDVFYDAKYLIAFEAGIDGQTRADDLSLLQEHGSFMDTRSLAQAGEVERGRQLSQFSPFLICALAISVVGIISSGILYAWLEKRNFAVFYTCGAPWERCFLAALGNGLFLMATALVLACLGSLILQLTGALENSGFALGGAGLALSGLLFAVVLCLSTVPVYFVLKRTQPAAVLQADE